MVLTSPAGCADVFGRRRRDSRDAFHFAPEIARALEQHRQLGGNVIEASQYLSCGRELMETPGWE
jgi:hypothetical protein